MENVVARGERKMSSARSTWFERNILFKTPLYKKQECGNFHWFRDRLCYCQHHENGHGIVDLKTGEEYCLKRDLESYWELYSDLKKGFEKEYDLTEDEVLRIMKKHRDGDVKLIFNQRDKDDNIIESQELDLNGDKMHVINVSDGS